MVTTTFVNEYKDIRLRNFFNLHRGAHHPSCRFYRNHVIFLGKHPLCIGCTFMTIGVIIAVSLISLSTLKEIGSFNIWLTGFILSFSSLVQIKLKPKKPLKIILRLILGIAFGFFAMSIVLISWTILGMILKCALLAIWYFVTMKVLGIRSKNIDDPCVRCEYGTYPFCLHKVPEMKNIVDSQLEHPIKEIQANVNFIPLLLSLIDQFEGNSENVEFIKEVC